MAATPGIDAISSTSSAAILRGAWRNCLASWKAARICVGRAAVRIFAGRAAQHRGEWLPIRVSERSAEPTLSGENLTRKSDFFSVKPPLAVVPAIGALDSLVSGLRP